METFKYQTTSKTILADLYTPVGVYMRLRDLYPQSALMESSDYHDKDNSRSFIGIDPMASVAIGHGVATVTYPDGTTIKREISAGFGSAEAILLSPTTITTSSFTSSGSSTALSSRLRTHPATSVSFIV